jgi:ABC-type nitrate/sulfonate/bicarbonate transport system permease component
MDSLKKLFIPFYGYGKDRWVVISSLVIIPFLVWTILPNHYLPPLHKILLSYPDLFSKFDMVGNFLISMSLCFKAITWASCISFLFMLLTRIPIFEGFCVFMRKFRFLPSAGLSFLFAKLTGDVDNQMFAIMLFGITTFMVDSSVGIALNIDKDMVDYSKSLRLPEWRIFYELIVLNKAPDFFRSIIQNFAIAWTLLATVENICKTSGGIGVVLAESSKYFRLEQVYAIQIIILATGLLIDVSLNKIYYSLLHYKTLKRV